MNLNDYLHKEGKLGDNYDDFLKLKQKLINDGIPEHLATYKASLVLLPEKLATCTHSTTLILTRTEEKS